MSTMRIDEDGTLTKDIYLKDGSRDIRLIPDHTRATGRR